MIFPLYSHKNGELVSLEGTHSKLYEYLPPDLEQKSESDREATLSRLESDLKAHDFGKLLKVYFVNGKTYINSELPPCFGESQTSEIPSPLEMLFGENLHSNIDFYEDYLYQNMEFIRLLTLKSPPDYLGAGGLLSLLVEGCDLILHLERFEKSKAKASLDIKRRMNFSSLFKELKDIDGEKAYEQTEGILESVISGEVSLFKCEAFILVRASNKKELDEKTSEVLSELKTVDAKSIIESKGLPYFYRSIIPGVDSKFKRGFDVPSDYLAQMIPFHKDELLGEGFELRARTSAPIKFNLFEPSAHNFNLLITGSSGQGKSMVANKLIKEELDRGTKVVCLDLGNSFRKNALFHKASIFSENFNPLQFKSPRYLKELILSCIDENFNKKEEGRLFEAIKKALENNPQDFDDLLNSLEKDFKGISFYFSEIKEYFTADEKGAQNFTYCDFSDYPEAIKAPLVIFLIEYFKNISGRKIFVFDECWSLLESNADYIAECFRTFRKHEASAVAISQNLDDFSETQLGRVIIQNTYFKFFFRQNLKLSEFVSEHLSNYVGEVQTVKGQYSEFVTFSESILKPTRFFPTPLEYELFTSDKKDQTDFEYYMQEKGRFLDFDRALENYTTIKYPTWRAEDAHS